MQQGLAVHVFLFATASLGGCKADVRCYESEVLDDAGYCVPKGGSDAAVAPPDGRSDASNDGGALDRREAGAVPARDVADVDAGAHADAHTSPPPSSDAALSPGFTREAGASAHGTGEVDAGELCSPTAEVCDGRDQDCDGVADNGLTNACGAPCGQVVLPEDCTTSADDDCDGTANEGCTPPPPSCVPVPEACDGKDQDCDGVPDNGVRNACGTCGAVPAETCDGKDNDCDGAIDEGVKNACGTCGSVPVERCDGRDNDCDQMVDEGDVCGPPPARCGDGRVEGNEQCEPTAAGWSTFTCAPDCKRKTIYRPCASNADCNGSLGERCEIDYAFCTKPCSNFTAIGPNSGCPAPGGDLVAQCGLLGDLSVCTAVGCIKDAHCGPGASCAANGTGAYCMGCAGPKVCASGNCVFQGVGSFGVCE